MPGCVMPGTDPPGDEFVQRVRSALAHLYDDAYLQSHPLGYTVIAEREAEHVTRAEQLREVLLDCIEQMRPRRQAGDSSTATRAYAILSYRYMDCLSMDDIGARLALSLRQVYREHDKGVRAVAALLYDRLGNERLGPEVEPAQALAEKHSWAAQVEIDRLRQAARPECFDVREVLDDVIRLLEPLTQERKVDITVAATGSLSQVVADRTLLRQALVSLLSHAAANLSQPGLAVHLAAHESGLQVEICGLLGPAAPASGQIEVNLQVALGLMEAQGGRLDLQMGDGTWRARLLLPTPARAAVLVVDDNADLIALVQRYLAGYAISVVGAGDGERALRLAPELQPQVIILDVMMPQQDGWEVLRRLKAAPETAQIPIVVCSVLNERYLAKAMGASGYITKPVTQAVLLQTLRPWLGSLAPSV